jgi:hypothetical protein
MSKIIVPDSIEPYIGWKALAIVNGFLCSPQQNTVWPKAAKLEAACISPIHQPQQDVKYSWQLEKGDPPPYAYYYVPGLDTANSTAPVEIIDWEQEMGICYSPPGVYAQPPDELPPAGHYWRYVDEGTEWIEGRPIATNYCTCGIYAVSTPQGCNPYFRSNTILAQVALWGTVTVAHSGCRGQYAYPQKLIVPKRLERVARQLAEDYGVPYEAVGPNKMTTYLGYNKHIQNDQLKGRYAVLYISLAAVMFSLASLIISITKIGPKWLSGGLSGAAVTFVGMMILAQFLTRR